MNSFLCFSALAFGLLVGLSRANPAGGFPNPLYSETLATIKTGIAEAQSSIKTMAETTDRLPNGVAGDSYCLVLSYIAEPHGERELKSAGFYLVTIPAYSRVPDDNQLLKLQVIQFQQDENDHRQDYINLYRQAFTTVGDLAAVNTAQLKIKGWVVTARYFAEIIKPAFGWAEEDKNDEDRNKEFDNPEYRYVELQPPLEQQLLDRVNKILRSQAGFVSLTKDD